MSDLSIACTLSPAALKARREGLLSDLLRRADVHEELTNGHRLRFVGTDDMLTAVLRAVSAERQCCGVHGRDARVVTANLAFFAAAGVFEIVIAFWRSVRQTRTRDRPCPNTTTA